MAKQPATIRFHFELGHRPDAADLRVTVGDAGCEVKPHSTTSRAAAEHPALAALPAQAHDRFTHYADLDAATLPDDRIGWVLVTRPPAPGVHLGEVAIMTQLIPEDYLRAYYRARFDFYRGKGVDWLRSNHRADLKGLPRLHSAKLADLGLTVLPGDEEAAIDLLVRSRTLVTHMDTAGTLVAFHPELANVQPYTATIVANDHILPDPEIDPDQFNAMKALRDAIRDTGDKGWSPVVPCTDKDGNPLKAEYDLDGFKAGQQLYTYGLANAVAKASAPATGRARRTASDDLQLAGKTWSPTQGTTALVRDGRAPTTRLVAGAPAFKWTVDEQTNHHGVEVKGSSIRLDPQNNFSINVNNDYLRTLYAGCQRYDGGKLLGAKVPLGSVGATNTIMGIPVPTDPTSLSFKLGDAASVELLFGSLGTSDWDPDVSVPGTQLTCAWQYGVPIVFLIAGKALTSTSVYIKIVSDRDLTAAALAILGPLIGAGTATAAALLNTKKVLFAFGNAVLSFALQKGLEKLGEWLVEQAGEGAIAKAFGPVGWVMQLVAAGLSVEQMAVTTAESLSSPATVRVKVSRAIDVALTLHPDPAHGEAGRPETAVWPAVATKYVVTLQYKGGTNRVLTGPLSDQTSNAPLPLRFADVPGGGQFRIIAGVYSANGWLAGTWQCDWTQAVPNSDTTLQLGDQHITESLVPLAPDSQYVYKEKVAYQGGHFAWKAGDPPPGATLKSLSCDSAAPGLCELVDLTLSNSGFQVGYAWRSSGQGLHPDSPSAPPSATQLYAMQNLSVLKDPDSRLKTTTIGFTNRPAIAYTPSTNTANRIDDTNFVLDPRGGGMHLRRVKLDNDGKDFGLGDPGLQSWGRFPLENIDALAIHPSHAVIAASWKDSKLMILNLPEAPSPDDKAPTALLVSGEGLRQGLTQGPRALAVAPDGRILVLETLNRRVQAFDTKGNPVPSFTPFPAIQMIPTAGIATSLDAGQVPEAFQDALRAGGVTFLFNLDPRFIEQLDAAQFRPSDDPLIKALSLKGAILAYDPARMGDPDVSCQIKVVQAGRDWIITDPRHSAWQVVNQGGQLAVYHRPTRLEVRVERAGQQWLIVDNDSTDAWRLVPFTGSPGQTEVKACLSYYPLQGSTNGALTFLDMAVEAQGYSYVLSHLNDGSQAADYLLDIYAPDGGFVVRSPDASKTLQPQNVVAGKIAVYIWRDLYALLYESLTGPGGGPQPGLAHWIPTPPLFALDLGLQADFNQKNIGTIAQAFAAHNITLSNQAFVAVDNPDGAWSVKDGATIYHIYRSGGGLQVYSVPA